MGVRGLSSFIQEKRSLISEYQLFDTKIIIDGLNLLYRLYSSSNFSIIYAGDYDKFGQLVRNCFECFKICNIEPIVVLDGGTDPSDRKRNTLMDRFINKLNSAWRISRQGETHIFLLPLMCSTVMIEVLKELGVTILQSEFEADEEIASLACHYKCPIVSNDSDFFLLKLPYGVVPLDSLDFTVTPHKRLKSCNSLNCEIYFVNNLLNLYPGVYEEALPLLGTLIGNDFTDVRTFDNFFDYINLPKTNSRKKKIPRRHAKLIGLLDWLANKTFEEAMDYVIRSLKQNQRNSVEKQLRECASLYLVKPMSHHFGSLDLVELPCVELESNTLCVTKQGKFLPKWFYSRFRHAEIHSIVMDMLTLHRIFLPPQISKASSPKSSHASSEKIRLSIYKVLLEYDGKSSTVEEYDRHLASAIKNKKTVDIGKNCVRVKLSDMDRGDITTRRNDFLTVLESNGFPVALFPEKLQFIFVVLNFYIQNSSMIKEDILNSWIMSVVLLGIVAPLASGTKANALLAQRCRSPLTVIHSISQPEAKTLMNKMSEFFRRPYHSNAKSYQSNIVQRYSELQSCLYYSLMLNQILMKPFYPTTMTCLSGTFIYNFCIKLSSKSDSLVFISKLLGETAKIHSLYMSIRELCVNNLIMEFHPQEQAIQSKAKPQSSQKVVQPQARKRQQGKKAPPNVQRMSNRFQSLSLKD